MEMTFELQSPSLFDEHASSALVVRRPLTKDRNMKVCGRCADMSYSQCNMSPPFSSARCQECTRAGVICPPHKPRRGRRRVQLHSSEAITSIPANYPDNISPETLSPRLPEPTSVTTGIAEGTQSTTGALAPADIQPVHAPGPPGPIDLAIVMAPAPIVEGFPGFHPSSAEAGLPLGDNWEDWVFGVLQAEAGAGH